MLAPVTPSAIEALVICPGCRTHHGDQLDVRTLQIAGDVLSCDCGRRYPIIDGVPIVLGDPAGYLRDDVTAIVERDLPPEVAALLVEHVPDDQPYARLLEHLSIYLDAHWGDRADPAVAPGIGPLAERIARLPRVGRAVELGCSVGRIVAELPADHVVGLDLQFGALRRARRILDGERVAYARRLSGRHYTGAMIDAGPLAVPAARRTLLCTDILDPPLIPAHYDRVVALNVLDSVARPRLLLSVVDGLCRPGGEVILSSPYAWQSSVMEERERIGGEDPAADVAEILRTGAGIAGRYEVEEEAEVSWTLRRDARSAVAYRVHYLRARKVGPKEG
jgi:SAM-dependent methyltransferase/uncharacterized protein YbaR (Trm112 family)